MDMEKAFTIEQTINPSTEIPFGAGYRGTFKIRRASLMDSTIIAQKVAAERNSFGLVDESQIPPGLNFASRVFHTVGTLAVDKLPDWFDRTKLHTDDDNDQEAILAVWEEVDGFLKSFRPAKGSGTGGAGGQKPQEVVPGEV